MSEEAVSAEKKMDETKLDPRIAQAAKGLGGGAAFVVLLMFYNSVDKIKDEVSEMKAVMVGVRTELDVVAPKDVKDKLVEMDKRMLNASDVQNIVQRSAPWTEDRDEIEKRIRDLEVWMQSQKVRSE